MSAGPGDRVSAIDEQSVRERHGALRERISAAGADPDHVRVIAVTKGFGDDAVRAARAAGLIDLGENYAQELRSKAATAPAGTRWHFLGPVQRNKVRGLLDHVVLWHGVDREAVGAELGRHADPAPVLVQVNLADDPGRPGTSWGDVPALVERLRAQPLDVRGLMGVAGIGAAREQFRRLARLAAELELRELSMGMSADLEEAVQEGATMVRVGTALFGARPEAAQMRR